MSAFVDLVGRVFQRLTVLRFVEMAANGAQWLCVCSCGTCKRIAACHLKSGRIRSCGCLMREVSARHRATHNVPRHGHTCGKPSPTWRSWRSMHERCRAKRGKNARYYRGIKICARWSGLNGFANFLIDMGQRPTGKTLDRYPNRRGNYEPTNCRWATATEQSRNRDFARHIQGAE